MGFNIKSLVETAANAPKQSGERLPEQVTVWVGSYKDKKTEEWKLKGNGSFTIDGTQFYVVLFKRSESAWLGNVKLKINDDKYVQVGQAGITGQDTKTFKVTLEDGTLMSCGVEKKTIDSLIFQDEVNEDNPLKGKAKVVFEGIVEVKVYGSSFSQSEEPEIEPETSDDEY